MTMIITGRFQQHEQAETAISDLVRSGIPSDQVTSFFVSPHGQHGDSQFGAENAGVGAMYGATVGGAAGLVLGLAAWPALGLTATLVVLGVGAYLGSLLGALSQMDDGGTENETVTGKGNPRELSIRTWGMLVAICSRASMQRATAIDVLRTRHAGDIGQTDGTFTAGRWSDFNRLTPIPLIVK